MDFAGGADSSRGGCSIQGDTAEQQADISIGERTSGCDFASI
jgi:hypothetical protein